MQLAYKVELYDAGTILYAEPDNVEYTGWDYGGEAGAYGLTYFGLSLLQKIGAITEEEENDLHDNRDDYSVLEKKLKREVWCNSILVTEKDNGNLYIQMEIAYTHIDAIKTPEAWYADITYRGSYSIVWMQ